MHCTRSKVSDRLYERAIRLENVLVAQARGLHPFEALPVKTLGLAAEALDDPHGQLHMPIVVGMSQSHEMAAGGDLDTELFAQLASEGRGLGFAGSDLPAGELPAPRHVLARGPLCDQYAPLVIKERARHHENDRAQPLLHALQRAVAMLEFLAGSARTELVAPYLTVPAHKRALRIDRRRQSLASGRA